MFDLLIGSFSDAFNDYFANVAETFNTDPFIAAFYFLLSVIFVPISGLSIWFSRL